MNNHLITLIMDSDHPATLPLLIKLKSTTQTIIFQLWEITEVLSYQMLNPLLSLLMLKIQKVIRLLEAIEALLYKDLI